MGKPSPCVVAEGTALWHFDCFARGLGGQLCGAWQVAGQPETWCLSCVVLSSRNRGPLPRQLPLFLCRKKSKSMMDYESFYKSTQYVCSLCLSTGAVKLTSLACGNQHVWACDSKGGVYFRVGTQPLNPSLMLPAWIMIEPPVQVSTC